MASRKRSGSNKNEASAFEVIATLGFQLGKIIGQGTYSKVFLVTKSPSTKLACKIINRKYAGLEFTEKFLPREIDIIRRIKHENIITIYRIIDAHGIIYMFMEYCKNGDLLEFIKQKGKLNESQAKTIFRQIVSAVSYLHSLEIAHRDLKCENVLLMMDYRVKLADFGFARDCIDKKGKLIFSNTFCGSAAYAPPEILQGFYYDPKMYDIWAMGCILFIMLGASMPFDDSNIKRMVKAQLKKSASIMIRQWKDVSRDCKFLLYILLEPIASNRCTIDFVEKCDWMNDDCINSLTGSSIF